MVEDLVSCSFKKHDWALMNAKETKKHKSRESYNLIINSIVLIYFLFLRQGTIQEKRMCNLINFEF